MKVYRHPFVQTTTELHHSILNERDAYSTVKEQLILLADNLYLHLRHGDPAALKIIENFHPDYHRKLASEIPGAGLGQDDCQLVIAKEYGYRDWEMALSEADQAFDKEFEAAIDYLVSGQINELELVLQNDPGLLQQHSPYWHSAGLIHYIASNGVEVWRQCVPENLVEITQMLLQFGANPNMPNNIYGGANLINLIETSAHPHQAGLAEALIQTLKSNHHFS